MQESKLTMDEINYCKKQADMEVYHIHPDQYADAFAAAYARAKEALTMWDVG